MRFSRWLPILVLMALLAARALGGPARAAVRPCTVHRAAGLGSAPTDLPLGLSPSVAHRLTRATAPHRGGDGRVVLLAPAGLRMAIPVPASQPRLARVPTKLLRRGGISSSPRDPPR